MKSRLEVTEIWFYGRIWRIPREDMQRESFKINENKNGTQDQNQNQSQSKILRQIMRKEGLENLALTGHTEDKTNRKKQRKTKRACENGQKNSE